MAQYGQMVDVVGDGHAFDGKHPVRSIMHPARVVWFHLERVDEGFFITICNQVVCESIVAILDNHGHDINGITQPGGS